MKSKKVELGISARNLVDADVFSKSDPMVVVEQQVRLFHLFETTVEVEIEDFRWLN